MQVFEARPAFQQTEQTIQMLDMLIESSSYDKPENSDFALFGSGGQILQALMELVLSVWRTKPEMATFSAMMGQDPTLTCPQIST